MRSEVFWIRGYFFAKRCKMPRENPLKNHLKFHLKKTKTNYNNIDPISFYATLFLHIYTSKMWRNRSSQGGCVACKIRQICWVSSKDTSSRSPIIIRSSSWDLAPGDSSSTGGSKLRGTKGLFRGCFLGVLGPFKQKANHIGQTGRWSEARQ